MWTSGWKHAFGVYGSLAYNNAPVNSGLYVFSQKRFATYLRAVTISTAMQALASNFCCSGMELANPSNQICNFPACNSSKCANASGCECPIVYAPSPLPILPSINKTECTCAIGSYGSICDGDICTFDNLCSPFADCTVIGPSLRNCSCADGYIGDGYVCSAIDCQCDKIAKCVFGKNGSYSCVCPPGYQLDSNKCTDFNECNYDNGGCDPRVKCTNTIGNVTCGSCPAGYTGSGYTFCALLCGDGHCDASIGEDCVSCPQDCTAATCGKCGDGSCQDAERCDSCSEDCGPCSTPGCPKCVNGNCNSAKGVCACTDGWTGPSCDETIQPIEIITNNTQPNVDILPSTKNDVSFSISLRTITEYTSSNTLVSSFDLQSLNFTFNRTLLRGSAKNTQYEYSTLLSNRANLLITFIQFNESGDYSFNNISTHYPANTLKLNVKISDWPFAQLTNFLNVVFDNFVVSAEKDNTCVEQQKTSASLIWVQLTLNGIAVYAQFDPSAIVDGRNRSISFTLQTDNSVVATLPHFWDFSELDPLYSVLLSPESDNGCSSKSSNHTSKKVIIAVVVSIVGTALIIAIVLYAYKVYKRRKTMSDLHVKMSSYPN
eukprot:Phypoly_transcript_03532.p1 GENE.Phypoly_transcript_03532~~Phypoly_transcript_03532.p1  ORF type:complete len:603 (+),score=53.04 Phypoly_transcript_03532:570-2378(+)